MMTIDLKPVDRAEIVTLVDNYVDQVARCSGCIRATGNTVRLWMQG
jgi:hypothetical protein